MRFATGEQALLLQQTLREFLRKECPPETVRALWAREDGHDPALWGRLAALGVPGALVPEADGGLGLDERDLVLLLEEIGRAALPVPVVATAAVAAPLLRDLAAAGAPGAARARAWLPRIADGSLRVAVGHPANPFVTDAEAAGLLLLPDDDALHAVPREEARLTRQPANDPGRRLASVAFAPRPETRLAEGETARRLLDAALDRGALACAAQLVGVADRLIELAVAHAAAREQFGRPIGSFQAVQHALADAKVRVEYARPVVQKAAHSLARGIRTGAVDASHAKLAAGEAAAHAARVALQVHGAIGYTWEQDLHLWMRRAWSLALEWGAPPLHLERVASFVLADGAPIGPGTTFADAVTTTPTAAGAAGDP